MSGLLMRSQRRHHPRGFTLTELLVVILIIMLVSAVALPTVIPAITNRQVGESARILQAALAGARDAAIRANAPRGIRLLLDPTLSDPIGTAGGRLACNRIVPIEPAPDLTDPSLYGSATFVDLNAANWTTGSPPVLPVPLPGSNPPTYPYVYPFPNTVAPLVGFNVLCVAQAEFSGNTPLAAFPIVNPPTNWFWNVRIGDKIRANDSGRYYTVVGPMTIRNPEWFVNDGVPGASTLQLTYGNATIGTTVRTPEYLFLVNGVDDDGDGFTDNGFDGVDQNLNGVADDMASASYLSEWTEVEAWIGAQAQANTHAQGSFSLVPAVPFKWTIARRPTPSPGAREVTLSGGAVIDLTSWNTSLERSRLPVDVNNGTVDILLNQAGQVIPTTTYSNPGSLQMAGSFYHFWIADRNDVVAASVGGTLPQLPIPAPPGSSPGTSVLKKDRHLVTLFARNGAIVTNSIENFDFANAGTANYDVNRPFDDAQLGTREAK